MSKTVLFTFMALLMALKEFVTGIGKNIKSADLEHNSPQRYLTQEKWIPTFWRPILNILDLQQPGMMKINRTGQAIFQFLA